MSEGRLHPLITWIRLIVGFGWVALMSIPLLMASLIFLPSRSIRIRLGNLYGKLVGPVIAWLTGTETIIENQELLDRNAPAIFVTNHTSALDVFIGMWQCPMGGCGVAKKQIAKVPFFGWAYKLSGHLLIDRESRERAIASLAELAQVVRNHKLSIWIWPEGTRSRDGRLMTFKKGFVHMAIATGLPVVPVVLLNAHHRWPGRTYQFYPGTLRVKILDAIDTSDWTMETVDKHLMSVWNEFYEALGQDQRPLNLPAT